MLDAVTGRLRSMVGYLAINTVNLGITVQYFRITEQRGVNRRQYSTRDD